MKTSSHFSIEHATCWLAAGVLISVIWAASISQTLAANYYVTTNGSDSSNGGASTPWRTLAKATATARAGDTVYVGGGTYYEQVVFNTPGSSGYPITFTAYPGQSPIITLAGGWPAGGGNDGIVDINANYIVFEGFEVNNGNSPAIPTSCSHGIKVTGSYAAVINNTIDMICASGIWIQSNYNLIQGNTVYDTSLQNYNGAGNNVWACAIAIQGYKNGNFLIGNMILNNTVYDNWGEGIYAFYGQSFVRIIGNTVYNNWSLNIGLANAYNSIIANNLSYIMDPPSTMSTGAAIVITIDNDSIDPGPNTTWVYNNMIYGSEIFVAQFQNFSNVPIQNTSIYFNTVVNPGGDALWIGGAQSGLSVVDNIFVGNGANPYYTIVAYASNNYWLTQPLFTDGWISNLSNPSTDIIGNALPYLAQTPGSPAPGGLTASWFQPLSNFPGRQKGIYWDPARIDALGAPRPVSSPDIGAIQY
ncbi:MAG TPA: right-handed parallel beta-helix repeat-containing protein [Methylocella sp.]|nr:right-handed parallel beta-helix repeat-containing protein [Methylocella sp.]